MEDKERLKLYKQLYFHELDARDKLTTRLQLCLAVLTAFVGALGYIFVRLNWDASAPIEKWIFFVFYYLSVFFVCVSAWYFVRALWNHAYQFMPLAKEIEDYRSELHRTYKKYGEQDTKFYFQKFLLKYFMECASFNAEVNECRSKKLHYSFSFIVYSIIPIVVSVVVFVIGHMAHVATT